MNRSVLNSELLEWVRSRFSWKKKALIGVSGGRDSMVLLHLLRSAGFDELIVCHLNHQLRGDDSVADEAFVEKIANGYGLDFEIGVADVAQSAKVNQISIELAARNARHEFFATTAAKFDCDDVFLAHHADDQVETVLINLFRGTGMSGLCGMQLSSEHKIDGRTLTFHRPLLDVPRSEIDRYCAEKDILFREDQSNANLEFALRNRLRHRLIPDLEETFGRDVRGAVLRLTKVMQMEEQVRRSQIGEVFLEVVDGNGLINSKALGRLAQADQYRVVSRWLRESCVPDCGFVEIERVLELLSTSGVPAKINLPGDIHARRRVGTIFLEKP